MSYTVSYISFMKGMYRYISEKIMSQRIIIIIIIIIYRVQIVVLISIEKDCTSGEYRPVAYPGIFFVVRRFNKFS
jgi:hypothetical protein